MLLLFIVSRSDMRAGNSLTVLQYSAKGGSRRLNWGGRGKQGVWGTEVFQWGPGAKPQQGVLGWSPPEAGAFL